MPQPLKPFTTSDEQIDILVARGLVVDRPMAEQWLSNVSYYRLSGYWYPFRIIDPLRPATRRDDFTEGATFEEVVRLYEFDRRLRTLVHDGIERIEVALRRHLGDVLGRVDPLAHLDPVVFRSTFEHAAWLSTADRRAQRASSHSESVRHHRSRYGGALPIWVLTEILDFSDLSRLYEGLVVDDQWTVAKALGLTIDVSLLSKQQRRKALRHHPLARWLEQLTVVRNTSAHHARLWNRTFIPAPTAALRTCAGLEMLPEGQSERMFGALTVMSRLTTSVAPGSSWRAKVNALVNEAFAESGLRSTGEMGFPTAPSLSQTRGSIDRDSGDVGTDR